MTLTFKVSSKGTSPFGGQLAVDQGPDMAPAYSAVHPQSMTWAAPVIPVPASEHRKSA